MRCLSCHYDLRNLTGRSGPSDHRCPECGRAFDPDDPRTWSTKPRRLSPNPAVFLPIVLGIWLLLTGVFFVGEVRNLPTGGSYILTLAEAAASAFILALIISLLLVTGFAFGRRKSSS